MYRLAILFFSLFIVTSLSAQSPKREFRAAWIATVANIDWPSKPGLPAEEQKQQFIDRLDSMQALGCNVVIVQVRPVSDAFYDSKIEPWSRYLTGKQGEAPVPYYDPLAFMVEETHKRNMEFHAWFNPFRATMDSKHNTNVANHITRTHPEWIINYGGKGYIDPGNPAARDYVINVICDVVKRYDIDAVHLDDYFYPYRIAGQQFGDAQCYNRTGKGMNKDDWRRDNVNQFIASLESNIKKIKPWVKLGISPFGVWRNSDKDAEGSPTHAGTTCYDDLYSDVKLWMQKGWIDYLLPQLYWEHGHHAASFSALMPWWYGHCYKRHVYYGLGVYRMTDNKKGGPWAGVSELLWQLRDIRKGCPENSGYAFYSASCFDKIKAPIKDSIKRNITRYPAFPPVMGWLDSVAPAAPTLKLTAAGTGALLQWQENNPKKEQLHYVVYRFNANEKPDLERTDRIIAVQQATSFNDPEAARLKQCTYVVTAMDRLWNESKPAVAVYKK